MRQKTSGKTYVRSIGPGLITILSAFNFVLSQIDPIYSFESEQENTEWRTEAGGRTARTGERFKQGQHSLRWEWKDHSPLRFLNLKALPWSDESGAGIEGWVYNRTPLKDKLMVRFLAESPDGQLQMKYQFAFGLDYRGWRAFWIRLDEDAVTEFSQLEGQLTQLEILPPPTVPKGTLYLDAIRFRSAIPYHRNADDQVPFLNPKRGGGRYKYRFLWARDQQPAEKPGRTPNRREKQAFKLVAERIDAWLIGKDLDFNRPAVSSRYATLLDLFHRAFDNFNSLRIKKTATDIVGQPLFTYKQEIPRDGRSFLSVFDEILLPLALAYKTPSGPAPGFVNPYFESSTVKDYILTIFDHCHDQGWADGSGLGSRDHGNLRIGSWAHTLFLMRNELQEAGILSRELASLYWHSKFGEIFLPQLGEGAGGDDADRLLITNPGDNADSLRTVQLYRLYYILCQEDKRRKIHFMDCWVKWSTHSLRKAVGLLDFIKPDFSVYHHKSLYLKAYGQNALHISCLVSYLLRGTPFARPHSILQNLKESLLAARIMCNKYDVPMTISGRWPWDNDLLRDLFPAYAYLAESYSPMDQNLLSAFNRLYDPSDPLIQETLAAVQIGIQLTSTLGATKLILDFAEKDTRREVSPEGNWVYPYGALAIHRRDDWMLAAKGWSRFVWDYEGPTTKGENALGNYLSHGSLLILGTGNPVSRETSGYDPRGWDWSRIPGTTVLHRTVEELLEIEAARNLTEETTVGGVTLDQLHGVFATSMSDKVVTTESLKARKSVFFFDAAAICIGSGIESSDSSHRVETVLFQQRIGNPENDLTFVSSHEGVSQIPYNYEEKNVKLVWILDSVGNGYVIPKSNNLQIVRQLQRIGRGEYGNSGGGEGPFEVAWINHGVATKNGGYEYVLLPQTNSRTLEGFALSPPYRVLRKDNAAHVVEYLPLSITGYAIFDSSAQFDQGLLVSVERPGLMMVKVKSKDAITLSLADPNYGWNWLAKSGQEMIEHLPSQPRKYRFTLKGKWELDDAYRSDAALLMYGREKTRFIVTCLDGRSIQLSLSRVGR